MSKAERLENVEKVSTIDSFDTRPRRAPPPPLPNKDLGEGKDRAIRVVGPRPTTLIA